MFYRTKTRMTMKKTQMTLTTMVKISDPNLRWERGKCPHQQSLRASDQTRRSKVRVLFFFFRPGLTLLTEGPRVEVEYEQEVESAPFSMSNW